MTSRDPLFAPARGRAAAVRLGDAGLGGDADRLAAVAEPGGVFGSPRSAAPSA